MIHINSITLNPITKNFISRVCSKQLESLQRVNSIDGLIAVNTLGSNLNMLELDREVLEMTTSFVQVYHNPELFIHLPKNMLSNFKHMMFIWYHDDEDSTKLYNSIWDKLDILENFENSIHLN